MIERWIAWSQHFALRFIVVAALLLIIGLLGTVRLYSDLRPDMTELLPDAAPSVRDMRLIAGKVGGVAMETVILHNAPPEALHHFADALAGKLQLYTPNLIRRVDYRTDTLVAFFQHYRWFFPEITMLQQLHQRLTARLSWEARQQNPLFVSIDDDPPPNFDDLRQHAALVEQTFMRFGDGYYEGDVPTAIAGKRTRIVVMLLRMAGTADNFALVKQVDQAVKKSVAELNPQTFSPLLQVDYAGDIASALLEHDALAEDLTLATILVVVVVIVSLIAYTRTYRALIIIGVPLAIGTLTTFAIAAVTIGHLNANTAFLSSIVLGNGINVSLVLFARYLEERALQNPPALAMRYAVSNTLMATLTASAAAGIAYSSLIVTQSRGFSQFGWVGGLGMSLCWLAAYGFMPALALLWETYQPLPLSALKQSPNRLVAWCSLGLVRYPQAVLTVALLFTAWCIYIIPQYNQRLIEQDFTHLRSQTAMQAGKPGWWDLRVDMLFGEHLTPVVLLGQNPNEAEHIAQQLLGYQQQHPHTTLGKVIALSSVVPPQQLEKRQVIAQISSLLTAEKLQWLPRDVRDQLLDFKPPTDLQPFTSRDLPDIIKERLTDTTRTVGAMVLVYPMSTLNLWHGSDIQRFTDELRAIPLTPQNIPIAGSPLIFADMIHAMAVDGPKAAILSLVGVIILVIVLLGWRGSTRARIQDACWVLMTLMLGIIWFLGLSSLCHLKLNMLNFIAFPITFGIGADYATNLVQRKRLSPELSIAALFQTTGMAVALCSWTTIVGYGSLLVAHNQALVSFGMLAVIGEIACLSAALGPSLALFALLTPPTKS